MKQIILYSVAALLLLLSSITYGQTNNFAPIGDSVVSKTSQGVSAVYTDLKQSAPAVNKAITSLAKELKVGVNAVWDVLVKQQLVWSWCYLTCIIISLFSWGHFYYRINEGRANKWGDGGDSPTSYHLVVVITLVLCCIFTFLSINHFEDMITGFINPSYGAMKTIMKVASEVK